MIQFGFVSDVNIELCQVRVQFPALDMISPWLPVIQSATNQNKFFSVPGINTHVACMMNADLDEGVCIGAIYDTQNQALATDTGITEIQFGDGSIVRHDASPSNISLKVGALEINVSALGLEIKKGSESLKQILFDVLAELQTEIHPTPSGPSSPPINAPQYLSIQLRLNNLFKP